MQRAYLACFAVVIATLAPVTLPASASAASAPTIQKLSASHVSATEALLTAKIRPEGAATKYELWIDPCVAPMECMTKLTMASGTTSATAKKTTVSASTAVVFDELGLQPGTEYEYGVIAESASGTVEVHKTFKTRRR